MEDKTKAHDSAYRTGPPRHRTNLRDHLESLAIAILLVLLVRQLGVEAFRIRHGSMSPTLLGEHIELRCPNCHHVFEVGEDKMGMGGLVECDNCHYAWSDAADIAQDGLSLPPSTMVENRMLRGAARVFVNKFIYHLRDPERWDVVVFRVDKLDETMVTASDEVDPQYGEPDSRMTSQNYIKRIVGLPGEKVQLADGDVYINGKIVRKTDQVQRELWMHVYDSFYPPEKPVFEGQPIWLRESYPDRWGIARDGGEATVDAVGLQEPALVRYGLRIVDYYACDGPTVGDKSGNFPVGDVRLAARIRPNAVGEDACAVLEVQDAGHRFRLRAGFGADGSVQLLDNGEVVARAGGGLSPSAASLLVLENYDDRIVVRLDGRELLRHDYEPELPPLAAPYTPRWARAVRFGAQDARLEFSRVRIQRDMFWVRSTGNDYTHRPGPYQLGHDEYFVLGDNSPQSSDSRSARWVRPGVSRSHLVGQTFFVFWPVHDMKLLRNGDPAE